MDEPVPDRDARILESLGEGVAAFDGSGQALMANRCMSELMGWAPEEVPGTPAARLFDGSREILRVLNEALRASRYAVHRDVAQEAEASVRHLRISTSPMPPEAGGGAILVARDVSELKRMEREMFQAEKMSALGRLAASVAHEVRNPLGAINIQLELLGEDAAGLPEPHRRAIGRRLAIANAEIQRMDRIVGNFLRFSRPPRLRLERTSLNDVVRRVFELVAPEAREQHVRLEQDLCAELPEVRGDEGQLGQALLNMMVNAFHAVEAGGAVRARTGRTASGEVVVELSDDGAGIAEPDLDRVFELYYTTKDEGTGLGLSIAQRIVYDHGGRMDVESRPSRGTTFRIYLPAAACRRAEGRDG